MATLFDLTNEYLELEEALMNGDPEEITDAFEMINDDIEHKLDSYAYIISDMQGQMEAIKKERERLYQRMMHCERSIDRLKTDAMTCLKSIGKDKFKTALHSFGVRTASKRSLQITAPLCSIPDELCIIKREPNKALLRKMIEEDGDVTYADLLPATKYLSIR